MSDEYRIVHNAEHYDVYVNGFFYCSADTLTEAAKDIEELRANEK